jgi:hypothetical protein
MMDTALYLFGMKLYRQKDSIEFFDADFMNTIYVRSDEFKGKTLQACCNIVNEYLTAHGTVGTNFKVVRLTNLEDFDLGGVVVDEGCEIALRMNSFQQTLKIKQAFAQARKQEAKLHVKYKAMPPNYYDSKLSSVFESCIRKKFVGLNTVNEIRSDYIKHFAR